MNEMNKRSKAILISGFTAGTLDIFAAILVYSFIRNSISPGKLLQYIAGGVYGKGTFNGGWATVLSGLVLHFVIAFIFAIIYSFLYPLVKRLDINKIISGIIYGCIVWVLMNYLVVPHSALHTYPKFDLTNSSISLVIVIICIGIPIAWITEKVFSETPDEY